MPLKSCVRFMRKHATIVFFLFVCLIVVIGTKYFFIGLFLFFTIYYISLDVTGGVVPAQQGALIDSVVASNWLSCSSETACINAAAFKGFFFCVIIFINTIKSIWFVKASLHRSVVSMLLVNCTSRSSTSMSQAARSSFAVKSPERRALRILTSSLAPTTSTRKVVNRIQFSFDI